MGWAAEAQTGAVVVHKQRIPRLRLSQTLPQVSRALPRSEEGGWVFRPDIYTEYTLFFRSRVLVYIPNKYTSCRFIVNGEISRIINTGLTKHS